MKDKSFSYCILQYTDDPSRKEFLNCGVLVFMPEEPSALLQTLENTKRLQDAFPKFKEENFFNLSLNLRHSVSSQINKLQVLHKAGLSSVVPDATLFGKMVLPDQGLSVRFTPQGGGLTDKSICGIAAELFVRNVK